MSLVVSRMYEEETVVIVPPSDKPTIIRQRPVRFRDDKVRLAWDADRQVEIVRRELLHGNPRTPLQAFAAAELGITTAAAPAAPGGAGGRQ
jgi:sRNA-binding carbon storage regulator CsrA